MRSLHQTKVSGTKIEEPPPTTNRLQTHESVEYEINIQLEQNATPQDYIFTEANSHTTTPEDAVNEIPQKAALEERTKSENSQLLPKSASSSASTVDDFTSCERVNVASEQSIRKYTQQVFIAEKINTSTEEVEKEMSTKKNLDTENLEIFFEPVSSAVSSINDFSSYERFNAAPIESVSEAKFWNETPQFPFANKKEEEKNHLTTDYEQIDAVQNNIEIPPISFAGDNEKITEEENAKTTTKTTIPVIEVPLHNETKQQNSLTDESIEGEPSDIMVNSSVIPVSLVDEFSRTDVVLSEFIAFKETRQSSITDENKEPTVDNKNIETATKSPINKMEESVGMSVEPITNDPNSLFDFDEVDSSVPLESTAKNKKQQISIADDCVSSQKKETTTKEGSKYEISDITLGSANKQNSTPDDTISTWESVSSKETHHVSPIAYRREESPEKEDEYPSYIGKEYLVLVATLGMAACVAYFVFKRHSASR